jgi:hypothetical protein
MKVHTTASQTIDIFRSKKRRLEISKEITCTLATYIQMQMLICIMASRHKMLKRKSEEYFA